MTRGLSRGLRKAVFLDRDGTLIRDQHHLGDARAVELLPGVTDALRRLTAAGFVTVLVTNQSAIGRGLISEAQYHAVNARMKVLLARSGAVLDASYFCPQIPASGDRTVVEHPDRKPGPGMLLRAAADLGLAMGASFIIGDLVSDVLAGLNAGCASAFLLGSPATVVPSVPPGFFRAAPDLGTAVDLLLEG